MAESKLESLVSRLEKVVQNEALLTRLEKAIEKLESQDISTINKPARPQNQVSDLVSNQVSDLVSNQVPNKVSNQPVETYDLSAIKTKLNTFKNLGHQYAQNSSNEDIKKMTDVVVEIFDFHERLVQNSALYKKPNDETNTKLKTFIQERLMGIDKDYIAKRKFDLQAKVIKEGCGTFFWFLTEIPVPAIGGVIESTEYVALKVKNMKIDEQTKWIDAFIQALKEVLAFVKANFPIGLMWKGKELNNMECVINPNVSTGTEQPKKEEIKPAAPQKPQGGPSLGALFAEINKGENITKDLKHIDKKKKTEAKDEIQPSQSVSHPTATSTVAPTTATSGHNKGNIVPVGPPKKYKTDNWNIENFVNDKTIKIEENEATIKEIVKIENCVNCGIVIDAKVKGIILNKCKKVFLQFMTVVSNVDIMHSQSVEVFCKGSVPSVVVDSCESIRVTLNQDLKTDIVSSKVSELNITHLNEAGEYEKDFPVTQQFVTRYDQNLKKFVTKPLDLFL